MFSFLIDTFKPSRFSLAGTVILTLFLSFAYESDPGVAVLEKVFSINHSLKGVKVTMLIKERINGEYIHKKTDFKIAYKPYRIYLKQYYPHKGLEILYVGGENNGKALINRNTKTISNIKLEPLGNMIRKNNHHSIYRAGFSYFLEVVEDLYNKYDETDANIWQYKGLVKYAGIICYKVVFTNDNFKYLPYKVGDNETLESISKKLKLCDYTILEKNSEIKSFEKLKPGSTIMVPSDYAKQIIVYIDKNRQFPVGFKTYDEKGLFQDYTYLNYELNPDFSSLDFNSNNPKYGFN
ncbi:hypothetical protein ES705_11632 [subsurface metagenome]